MTSTDTLLDTGELLTAAADLLAEHGWTNRGWLDYETGAHDLVGALRAATGAHPDDTVTSAAADPAYRAEARRFHELADRLGRHARALEDALLAGSDLA
jgi:hypothetical protein